MQLPPDISFELLDRYLTGRCFPEEAAQAREAFVTNPELAALQRVILGASVDVETAWRQFVQSSWMQERVGETRPLFLEGEWENRLPTATGVAVVREAPARPRARRTISINARGRREGQALRRTGWYTLVGAAAAVMVIAAGWRLDAARMLQRFTDPEVAYTTYVTGNGERATVALPDGNTVMLNVASRLEVPTNYGASNHVVRLPVGEALFTVSHHTKTPFTVNAGAVTARVLGTNFMVRHYRTDAVATVAVAEGKVAVGNTVVTAQHLVEVNRTGVQRVRSADASAFTFATGVLTLGATRLSNAIPELDRWYDADIRLGDETLATKQIEGTVRAGSLTELIELLEWTFEVRVVRDGRVLTLYPKAT